MTIYLEHFDMQSVHLFQHGMKALAAMFPRDLTDDVCEVYWRALGELTDEEFTRAVALAVRDNDRFPSAATLRGLARPQINLHGEAGRAFAAIQPLGIMSESGHSTWGTARLLRGLDAREVSPTATVAAFLAIGGSDAWDSGAFQFRWKDFLTEYVRVREEEGRQDQLKLIGTTAALRLSPGAPGGRA